MIIQLLKTVLPVLIMISLGMVCRKTNYISRSCIDGLKKLVVNIMLPVAIFHGLSTAVLKRELVLYIAVMFAILCITFILGFILRGAVKPPYNKYFPFVVSVYEGGMIGYSLYTGLVGAENLSYIAVIDIAGLLFTFSIMTNVLVAVGDGKKVKVTEIIKNAFRTPAFLAVVLGLIVSFSGTMNDLLATQAGTIWLSLKDILTAAMSPMILLVVGYEVQISKKILGICLKTVMIRAIMQAVFAIGFIALLHALGKSNWLLELAVIVYMSLPGSMSIQTFIKDEEAGRYIANCNSLYLVVTIAVYAILAGSI